MPFDRLEARVHHPGWQRSSSVAVRGARADSAKVPTIGYMAAADASLDREWIAAFVQRLGGLGWNHGRTITMISRWAEGRRERYPAGAVEALKVRWADYYGRVRLLVSVHHRLRLLAFPMRTVPLTQLLTARRETSQLPMRSLCT